MVSECEGERERVVRDSTTHSTAHSTAHCILLPCPTFFFAAAAEAGAAVRGIFTTPRPMNAGNRVFKPPNSTNRSQLAWLSVRA